MKKIFLFVFLQIFIGVLLSQEYIPGILRVVILDDKAKPISEQKTSNPLLNEIFEDYEVKYISRQCLGPIILSLKGYTK